ncbi:MAG: right-handed parallel beta-helix repeat-containing protein, partial [Candidatus Helarchaeota archaeon]
ADPYVIENKTIITNGDYCIRIYYTNSHFVIRNCTLSNATYAGIDLYQAGNGIIENNTIFGNKNGIKISKGSNYTIAENTIFDNEMGIYSFNSSDYMIAQNTIFNNAKYGLQLQYISEFSFLNNRIFDNSYGGLWLLDIISAVTIELNHFLNNSDGIRCSSASGGYNISISHNIITNGRGYGVVTWNIENFTVRNNTISQCDGGICILECKNGSITANTIVNVTGLGIYSSSYSCDIAILNNSISSCDSGVYLADTAHSLVANNTVNLCKGNGIGLSASYNNWVIRNSITNCSSAGIYICGGQHNIIAQNIMEFNEYGIRNELCCCYCNNYSFFFNTICHSVRKGVYLDRMNNSTFAYNIISHSGDTGLYLVDSDYNIIKGNLFNCNRGGGYKEWSCTGNIFENNTIISCPSAIPAFLWQYLGVGLSVMVLVWYQLKLRPRKGIHPEL